MYSLVLHDGEFKRHYSLWGLYRDLIDNLSTKEEEMREVCFLMPYPEGEIGGFVKQEAMLHVML